MGTNLRTQKGGGRKGLNAVIVRAKEYLAVPEAFRQTALGFPAKVDKALALIDDPRTAKELLDKADTMAHYANRIKADTEIVNSIQYGKLKIIARLDKLDPPTPPKERGRGKKKNSKPGLLFSRPTRAKHHKVGKHEVRIDEYFLAASHTENGDPAAEVSVDGFIRFVKEDKKQLEKERRAEELAKYAGKSKSDCRVCSMESLLGKLTGLDAIITDPPYGAEYVPLYGELAKLAKNSLRPAGVLAVMCGQSYLPDVLAAMTPHIPYRWTMAYLTPGPSVQLWQRKVNTFWKPILLFGAAADWIGDVVKSSNYDKRFHEWGQSEGGMREVVEKLTVPNAWVCDPFLGAGTTGVVCAALGRRFTGCDTDPECVATAKKRIAQEMEINNGAGNSALPTPR